jgi:alpha-1,2-mannosyltransferase
MHKAKTARAARAVALLLGASVASSLAFYLYAALGFPGLVNLASPDMAVHPDYDIFRLTAAALWEGNDIYRGTGAPGVSLNPPAWALIFSPFVPLKPIVGFRVFLIIALLAMIGCLAWMVDELRLQAGWTAVGVAALLLSAPLQETLGIGQIYTLLALGIASAWILRQRGSFLAAGVCLGLVAVLKPSLLPVLLWPALLREWRMLVAAIGAGSAVTLVGVVAAGPGATLEYARVLSEHRPDGSWDNASLLAAAARLFTHNDFARPLAEVPWALPASFALGLVVLGITAAKVWRDPGWGLDWGLWALIAASLLASPVSWRGYFLLIAPGILLLFARGRYPAALLLSSLLLIPNHWTALWYERDTVLATMALTLSSYILVACWLTFLLVRGPLNPNEPIGRRERRRAPSR